MPVNVERIIEDVDRRVQRLEADAVRQLRTATNDAYRRLAADVRRRWPAALEDARAAGTSTFAEARARVLLEQLRASKDALEGATARGITTGLQESLVNARQAGFDAATALLTAYDVPGLTATATAAIDFDAVQAQVLNSSARLAKHSQAAIQQIDDAVVDALVQGQGSQRITRRIREVIRGDGRTPDGGLAARAETIARTEIATAKSEAARDRYKEVGVEFIQWYATVDERTCPWCGYRHGNVYAIDDVTVPAHPRCRCYAAPFRREFTEAGLADVDTWREQQNEIQGRLPEVKRGATPFEKAQGKPYPKIQWSPTSGWL